MWNTLIDLFRGQVLATDYKSALSGMKQLKAAMASVRTPLRG